MKKLSLEEKARRYDDLLVRLQEAKVDNDVCDERYCCVIDNIVPELKESEGERIRKTLIAVVNLYYGEGEDEEKTACLYWLEKQGEYKKFRDSIQVGDKVTRNEDGVLVNLSQLIRVAKKQSEQKPADEPKYKAGDWVIDKQGIVHQIANVIENVTNHTYGYDIVGGGYFNDNTEGVRLWTIQDAKVGDVLFYDSTCGFTFIYEGINSEGALLYSYIVSNDGSPLLKYNIGKPNVGVGYATDKNIYPATKEQRYALMKAMTDAGYTFDFEKKELRKIEQKPADWSEQDERKYNNIIALVEGKAIMRKDIKGLVSWFKSLKDRVQPKQEWSEEDEKMIENIIDTINMSIEDCDVDDIGTKARFSLEKERDWLKNKLKSLRPQNHWKPSEGHIFALESVIDSHPFANPRTKESLQDLVKQLKAL